MATPREQVGGEAHAGVHEQLAVIGRRRWWILGCAAALTASTLAFSLHLPARYQASAEVLLNRQSLASVLTPSPGDASLAGDPTRMAETQANLARASAIAAAVVRTARVPGLTTDAFLRASSVTVVADADVLRFTVTAHVPGDARRLATVFAERYIAYRRALDTSAIGRAIADVERRLRQLAAQGGSRSSFAASLLEKDQQLRTMAALQTSNASLFQQADQAVQTEPQPVRNAALALVLGLVLGFAAAFLREALDTKIRSAGELGERLGLPLLARIPAPPRRVQERAQLVTLTDPGSPGADAFRVLRMNLAFANHGPQARTIMVTSCVEQEGKSTTIANLAVSLALAGKRVVLVDLDLRRPYLDRFFRLTGRPGLTEVALGQVDLDAAVAPVPLDAARQHVLRVLVSGALPPDPGEVVAWPAVAEILDRLAADADFVLVDAPPMLSVGDAVSLSEKTDGMFVVARSSVATRPGIAELRRQLASVPAAKLGFVLTQAETEPGYSGTYHAVYGAPARRRFGRRGAPAAPGLASAVAVAVEETGG